MFFFNHIIFEELFIHAKKYHVFDSQNKRSYPQD